MAKKFSCLIGIHKWKKFMGPQNIGGGKFAQKYKCVNCEKVKREIR